MVAHGEAAGLRRKEEEEEEGCAVFTGHCCKRGRDDCRLVFLLLPCALFADDVL